MRLRTLGGLKLDEHGFSRPKPLLLLSYLSLEGSQDRRHLAELFYPGSARPLGSLASELTRIRKAIPGAIGASEERAWSELDADAQELLTALEEGDLDRALELYQGRFLDGLHLKDWGSELEEWVYGTREFIANRVREALIKLAESAANERAFERAAELSERAYFLSGAPEPEPEELGRMHTLLVAGSSPRAGEVRKEAASFGITLETDEAAARAMLVGPPEAEQVATSRLPELGTSFVGRNAELLELSELLSQDEVRLLTLAAPGGVGKTRLALRLARHLQGYNRFPDGVLFVPLEALESAAMIPGSIATELGLMLHDREEPRAQVARFIGDKKVLLVLDNFEHLLEGAIIVADLVLACPNLKVLVTSRERLNLAQESRLPPRGPHQPTQLRLTTPGSPVPGCHRTLRSARQERRPALLVNQRGHA